MTPTGAQPLGNLALLAADEPPAFEIVNAQGSADAVLVCDHASNRIPRQLASLGLTPYQLLQHIAWDPGAAEVARRLAARIDAPLILGGYSRLVIDLNRPLASPESIPEQSAGVPVSGNCGLTPQARDGRVAALFAPYHQAISDLLERRAGQPTLLISIHSFPPVLGDERRPWPVGVAYGRDRRLADLLRPALYGAFHRVEPVAPRGRPAELVDVVGPVCETSDFLARRRELERPEPGDLLAVRDAGAYAFAMSSNYNMRPRAAEALVEGGRVRLIRRRETFDDLVRTEI